MRLHRLAAIAWKELLELRRDPRTLLAVTLSAWLLPLLALMTHGLQGAAVLRVAVVDLDCSNATIGNVTVSSVEVALELKAGVLLSADSGVEVEVYRCEEPGFQPDVEIVIPPGFTRNLTSMREPALILVRYNPSSSAAQTLYTIIRYVVVPAVSRIEAEKLIRALSAEAGVSVDPDVVLDPVRVETGFIGVPRRVGERVAAAVEAAKTLSFAIIFVLAPAAILASDLFVYEKERRNLEMLLASPLRPSELVGGKALAAGIVAGLAGAADAAATLAYLYISGGFSLPPPTPTLVAVHVAATILAILATAAMTAVAVMAGVSTRIASLLSGVYTLLAFFVYTASLTIDYTRLPLAHRLLLALIPYTHSVYAVLYAAAGSMLESVASLAVLTAYTLGLLALSSRIASPERIVRSG